MAKCMSGHHSGHCSRAKVWVRTKPTACFAQDMIELLPDCKTVNIHTFRDPRHGVINNQIMDWSFRLDGVLHNSSQEVVYDTVARDVVSAALDGFNGTIMAYGQTGAGKTFTMTGATENYKHRGLIPRALAHLFKEIDDRPDYAINIRISFMEIYNEMMSDLLCTLPESMKCGQQCPMTIAEDEQGVYVKGLLGHLAQNEEEALNMLFEGETNRAIACHTLNKQSSRSHCIFTVYIESRSRVESNAKYTCSKLNFVDLAGSERLSKTQSEGRTKEEAMYINKSLSFLEQVVLALADKRREHVPFRQSKLTHCLKDSIGGNCYTRLIANIWGECAQIEETVSTLRFATRMMCVSVEPAANVHYNPSVMVKNLERELFLLKKELAMHDTLANRSQITYDPLSEQQRYEIRQQVKNYLEGKLDELDIVNIRQIQGVFDAFKDIFSQMSKDIENRMRSQYVMIDKSNSAAIAAAQKDGMVAVNEDGELVGETEPFGFGVGTASPTAKAASSSVINAKKREQDKSKKGSKLKDRVSPQTKGISPTLSAKTPAAEVQPPPSVSAEKELNHEESVSAGGSRTKLQSPQRPSTPPPRTEAFEDFKKDLGSEINRILIENKEILALKKKAYTELAKQVNITKEQMDGSCAALQEMKACREADGPTLNEDGDTIISEAEYLEIKHLKDLKAVYRTNYEELKSLKAEVQYCQKLVDQCRQRLIQEFDSWYAESYLTGTDIPTSLAAGVVAKLGAVPEPGKQEVPTLSYAYEDAQERFDRLQMELLQENPDSAPFYNAQMRTHRRKIYDATMSQPAMRRAPAGTPTRVVLNQPPTLLEVHY